MKTIITLVFSLFLVSVSAQQNEAWFKIRKFRIAELDAKIEETSALSFLGNRLFTLNDSGNPAELYEINPTTGELLNTFRINGTKNTDWEALTNDGNYFYIGDIGNNSGSRKNLKIYKISVNDAMANLENDGVQEIKFHYPEQDDFSRKAHKHNFDAESLSFINDQLHLFTKEWESYHTTHYVIPTESSAESYKATKLETYNLGFMATDSAYFQGRLYIIGYTKNLEVYLSIFDEDESGLFFNKNPKKFYLGMSSSIGQAEGIAVNEQGIYISAERFRMKPFNTPQRFYFIPFSKFKE